MLPDRALSSKSISGHKKEKSRITISLCVNADGSDKRPLIVIGTAKKPRCFKNVNMSNLGVLYRSNPSAWMTACIFTEWITEWEKELVKRQKRILLLMDNVSSHSMTFLKDLKQIRIVFLPPRTTAKLQLLDAGIIQSFKMQYRKLFLRWTVNQLDNRVAKAIDLRDAIEMSEAASEMAK